MYRGSCHCQAIQYEIEHLDELEADNETLTQTDTSQLSMTVEKERLVIDCAPFSLAKLHEANGETHHVCNVCASVIFVELNPNKVRLEVTFTGHDALAEPHRQFML
ncbi:MULTISPECIES: hypothetical protein [Alteromonas]|jgi:hypothetical protein|uniref:ADP-ribosylglycohydrolase n=1 Tax=Alteromonas marina TaxID=203795 RepID=A0A0B3Z7F5_9ALTE|nr:MULTISPECIES: hypothetical protein [Alteromonas]KHT54285.1 ADP-ribosylglycohydrolase [Alteromonas marina]MEC7358708.1 ADP-ribosylglycohydrolase [Pseudomonadota bacterium]MEC9335178.1 ADP-ribosylglycohydrolase [Pseudomonadota bacterium]|tara:strand:- start:524 stop:841 length:318 start_codon:yes stop_codon:yes gene_type:complete